MPSHLQGTTRVRPVSSGMFLRASKARRRRVAGQNLEFSLGDAQKRVTIIKMLRRLLIIFISATFLTIGTLASSQDRADQPVYSDGDRWVFTVIEKNFSTRSTAAPGGEYEVVYKGAKVRVFQIEEGEKKRVKGHGTLFGRMLGISVSKEGEKGEKEFLKFPLFIGKSWTTRFLENYAKSGPLKWHTADNQVKGIESVTVPAGTFRVFKIERTVVPGMDFIYYYSIETKSIVEYHLTTPRGKHNQGGTRDIVLIRFRLNH